MKNVEELWMQPGFWAAALLCLAAGFADAIGFIHSGVFTANMTGNTVLLGMALAYGDWIQILERAYTVLSFVAGVFVGRMAWQWSGKKAVLPLLLEAVVLGGASLLDAHSSAALWTMAVAMGIQATALAKFCGVGVSTVVITSTLARLTENLCDALLLRRFTSNVAAPSMPTLLLLNTCVSYMLGACMAVLMQAWSHVLWLPALLVMLTAWLMRRN